MIGSEEMLTKDVPPNGDQPQTDPTGTGAGIGISREWLVPEPLRQSTICRLL